MTAISISLTAPFQGMKISDFTVGTAVPGAGDLELRINTTDAQGNAVTLKEVQLALHALERQLLSSNTNVSTIGSIWPTI